MERQVDLMPERALVFPDVNRVELRSIDPPGEPGPREVRIRVELSGVSQGTEVWALVGKRQELQYPTIPGYQAIGVIEEVGQDSGEFVPGDRVLFHKARVPNGYPNTWMGTHQSVVLASIDSDPPIRKLPAAVAPDEAVLAAMVAVSLRGIQMLDVPLGCVAVVTGQGLIGQAAAQLLRARGAYVMATDLSARRLELSRAHSSDRAIHPLEEDLGQLVREIAPNGADIVCDTTGRAGDFAAWIDLLRQGGQLLMQGFYPDPVTFDFAPTHIKRPHIAITCGTGDTQLALDLIARKRIAWAPMVTHRVPIAEAPAIYQRMAEGDPDLLGVVLDWGVAS